MFMFSKAVSHLANSIQSRTWSKETRLINDIISQYITVLSTPSILNDSRVLFEYIPVVVIVKVIRFSK